MEVEAPPPVQQEPPPVQAPAGAGKRPMKLSALRGKHARGQPWRPGRSIPNLAPPASLSVDAEGTPAVGGGAVPHSPRRVTFASDTATLPKRIRRCSSEPVWLYSGEGSSRLWISPHHTASLAVKLPPEAVRQAPSARVLLEADADDREMDCGADADARETDCGAGSEGLGGGATACGAPAVAPTREIAAMEAAATVLSTVMSDLSL